MVIHFHYPLNGDVVLCGELAEELVITSTISQATCPRCRELIGEISRQALIKIKAEAVSR